MGPWLQMVAAFDANKVSWGAWSASERPPFLLLVQCHCGIGEGEAELGSCILGHETHTTELE